MQQAALRRFLVPAFFFLAGVGPCGAAQAEGSAEEMRTLQVSSAAELVSAVAEANKVGNTTIELHDGVYRLQRRLGINGNNITLRSRSGVRERVVLVGNGMRATGGVDNLVDVSGRGVSLVGLTLQDAGNHLVQLHGEHDADDFALVNCVLRDGYQQFLKVSAKNGQQPSADYGIVRNSLFEYSDALAPDFYTGGIDLHAGRGWRIEGNTFRNFASPRERVAEHAIHLWRNSADAIVRDNLILNSDRGIGFGMTGSPANGNRGGEISGNVILHLRSGDPFSDVGIGLESSPDTLVAGNFIYLAHGYPNAIEYRFEATRGVSIMNNLTNRAIVSRDGAEATVAGNQSASWSAKALDYLRFGVERLRERLDDGD